MSQIQIETGIPIPPHGNSRRCGGLPFRDMAVGQSFFVKGGKRTSIATMACRFRPMKFTVRPVEGGVRVWRVA